MVYDLIENYYYVLYDLADPRVVNWFLPGHPIVPLTSIALYLLLVYSWLPKFMQNRRPYSLKAPIFAYNVFQIAACSSLVYLARAYGSGKSNYWFGCYRTDYSENPPALRILLAAWCTHALKLVEFVETVFFVLRKKYRQVSFLHVYHHAATYAVSWFLMRYSSGGSAYFPAFLNNFVHVIMYSYYLLSASGPKMQAKLAGMKPFITIMQMVQLCIIITVGTLPLRSDCDLPMLVAWAYIPNIVVFLVLFMNFFLRNYMGKRKEKL